MTPTSTTIRATRYLAGRRRPRGWLRRALVMSLIALCNVALLLATLEACVEPPEANAEAAECECDDLANPPESVTVARRVSIKRLPARSPRNGFSSAAAARFGHVATTAAQGHRLTNGLCAPLRC